jgi:hypothetical protein
MKRSSLLSYSLSLFLATAVWAQDYPYYVDIHFKSATKPFNSRSFGGYNIWEPIYHECGFNRSPQAMQLVGDRMVKYSQSHFEALVRGHVRFGCLSLSPIEQQFISSSELLNDKTKRSTVSCINGVVANELFLRRKEIDYFEDLLNTINYVKRFERRPHYISGEEYLFSIIRNKKDLDSVNTERRRIGYVFTVDGGHSLGHSIYINERITDNPEYKLLVLENVRRLKGISPVIAGTDEYLDVPILWMSITKHYENGLGSQSLSLNKNQQTLYKRPEGIGGKPTKLGEEVIDLLLSTKGGGRRILLDIRNMSLNFRKYYYEVLKSKIILNDQIPIVVSSTGISNLGWNNPLYKSKDTDEKNNNSYLNHWERNLAAEDVVNVFRSKGLIGISLDKSVLAGQLALNEIAATAPNSYERRQACVKLFLANVFTAVDIIYQEKGKEGERRKDNWSAKEAWDIICIGSNFDDMLEPLDPYPTAEYLPDLANDIQEFLSNPQRKIGDLYSSEDIERLMQGYTADQITKKLLFKNAQDFIQRNLPEVQPK